MLRVSLLRLSSNRSLLQVCTHQILLDGWSLDQLQREVLASCFTAGELSEAATTSHSARHSETQSMERGLAYWREKTQSAAGNARSSAGSSPSRALANRERAHESRADFPSCMRGFAPSLESHDTTPFAVLLGAFALLLQRYSGQSDMGIAVPLLRRHDIPSDALGNFTNTTVVRLNVSSAGGFSALVAAGESGARGGARAR